MFSRKEPLGVVVQDSADRRLAEAADPHLEHLYRRVVKWRVRPVQHAIAYSFHGVPGGDVNGSVDVDDVAVAHVTEDYLRLGVGRVEVHAKHRKVPDMQVGINRHSRAHLQSGAVLR
jgi:hypothetical protein